MEHSVRILLAFHLINADSTSISSTSTSSISSTCRNMYAVWLIDLTKGSHGCGTREAEGTGVFLFAYYGRTLYNDRDKGTRPNRWKRVNKDERPRKYYHCSRLMDGVLRMMLVAWLYARRAFPVTARHCWLMFVRSVSTLGTGCIFIVT